MLLSPHAFLDSSQPIHHSIYLPISPVLGHDSSILRYLSITHSKRCC